jgi:hypothetical protein
VKPSHAAWILTALFAVAVSASVYRIPIQVSDSVEILEAVDKTPSIAAAFTQGLYASRTMLRPMRQTVTKALLGAAHALGDRYNLVFRGFHAATAAVLIGLFTLVARPRRWADVAALAFALLVLTGLHTFTGMVREAYPINHFLLVAIYCLIVFALAQARGGLWADVAACACFAVASLTLESGLVVATVAFAAYAAGLRGISRGALVAIAALTVGYVILRVGGLHMIGNAVGERQTGFGTMMLSTTDLRVRFDGMPWVLYAYTILSSALTVPFSQPIAGQWTAIGALRAEDFQDLFYLNDICTSLVATTLVVWYYRREAPTDGAAGGSDSAHITCGAGRQRRRCHRLRQERDHECRRCLIRARGLPGGSRAGAAPGCRDERVAAAACSGGRPVREQCLGIPRGGAGVSTPAGRVRCAQRMGIANAALSGPAGARG